jgi:hypothetical protein
MFAIYPSAARRSLQTPRPRSAPSNSRRGFARSRRLQVVFSGRGASNAGPPLHPPAPGRAGRGRLEWGYFLADRYEPGGRDDERIFSGKTFPVDLFNGDRVSDRLPSFLSFSWILRGEPWVITTDESLTAEDLREVAHARWWIENGVFRRLSGLVDSKRRLTANAHVREALMGLMSNSCRRRRGRRARSPGSDFPLPSGSGCSRISAGPRHPLAPGWRGRRAGDRGAGLIGRHRPCTESRGFGGACHTNGPATPSKRINHHDP